MSMALALEFTEHWFREQYGLKPNECGVQQNALPSLTAGQFFIAIDDAGVEGGRPDTDSLKELLSIVVGIWRRPEHLQQDKRGHLKHTQDRYLIGAWTLHKLERMVLVHKSAGGVTVENKHGLHQNWAFVNSLNSYYNLPHEEYGAKFIFPFTYRGRGSSETIALGEEPQAWFGYKLRFAGLGREQKMRATEDAIG